MRNWCLCQICTCGRHRCPHGTTRVYEHSGTSCPTTEYLEKYPNYGNVLPPQSLKPKQEFQARRGKMEGVTTFKSDYRPYEVIKQTRHIPEEYKPKQGEIDLGTTYKRDFNPFKVQPVVKVRPVERQQVKKGKLDTVPTYKENEKLWISSRLMWFDQARPPETAPQVIQHSKQLRQSLADYCQDFCIFFGPP